MIAAALVSRRSSKTDAVALVDLVGLADAYP
jgi:hypothetical protein